jgi:hypothetical protein
MPTLELDTATGAEASQSFPRPAIRWNFCRNDVITCLRGLTDVGHVSNFSITVEELLLGINCFGSKRKGQLVHQGTRENLVWAQYLTRTHLSVS